jgi:CBS domain containing-hemolysin-like protein
MSTLDSAYPFACHLSSSSALFLREAPLDEEDDEEEEDEDEDEDEDDKEDGEDDQDEGDGYSE